MQNTYPTQVRVSDEVRTALCALLNTALADVIDLYLAAKHAHWNVKGRHFYSLHQLFDHIADHLRAHADGLAERAATLGAQVEGLGRQIVGNSRLPEYDQDAVGEEHVDELMRLLAEHAATLRAAIDRTGEDLKDMATQDLLMEQLREVEEDLWMLESHLQEERPLPEQAAESVSGGASIEEPMHQS